MQQNLNMVVPYKEVRDEILRALPFPETRTVLEVLPLPTEPIVSSQGVVDPQIGRWRGLGTRKRTENAPLIKGEAAIFNGGASPSPTRGCGPSPWSPGPSWTTPTIVNIRTNRIASLPRWSATRGRWVSESRVGWNRTYLARLDAFLSVMQPNAPPRSCARTAHACLQHHQPLRDAEVRNLGYEGHHAQLRAEAQSELPAASRKAGFRFMRETGDA